MVELKFIEVKQITQRYIHILFSNKAIKLVFKPRWIDRYIQIDFLYNPSMKYLLKKVKMTYVYNYG